MSKRTQSEKNTSSTKRIKLPVIPQILLDLQKKFEAINVFYAFCDARLTSSITFESLQKAVDNLTIEDLCAINVIIPDFVKFNSVSDQVMEVEFGRSVSKSISKQKHALALGNRGDDWFNGFFKKSKDAPSPPKPDAVKKMIEQKNNLFIKSMKKFIKHCADEVTTHKKKFLI